MSWTFRLMKQSEISTSAIFLTLTYNDEHVPKTLIKTDYQLFLKRLRKTIPNSTIKYYACGEYGAKTSRPHYHAIMFNLPQNWVTNPNLILDVWGKGNIFIAPCNIATIKYVTKYIMKGKFEQLANNVTFPGFSLSTFSLMSKQIGSNYLTPQMVKHHKDHLKSHVTLAGGTPQTLPRYFKDKIFTIEEKIKINEESKKNRNLEANQFKTDPTWINDQFRKAAKKLRLTEDKL